MKTTTTKGLLALTALTVTLMMAGLTNSSADYYHHNHDGYWDGHNHYHHYTYYHGQQGYWYPQPNGVHIWINI